MVGLQGRLEQGRLVSIWPLVGPVEGLAGLFAVCWGVGACRHSCLRVGGSDRHLHCNDAAQELVRAVGMDRQGGNGLCLSG